MDRSSNAPFKPLDPCAEPFYNLANATHLVEFDFEFIDFAEDGAEAGNFGVGHLYRVAGAVVLDLGCDLGLGGELKESCQLRLIY